MKLKSWLCGMLIAVTGHVFAAPPVDLGVLDSGKSDFGRNFGRIFGFGSPVGAFTDYYTFTIAALGNATGGTIVLDWGSLDLTLTSVSLTGGTLGSAVQVDYSPQAFSFNNLGIGQYVLGVSGRLADVGLGGLAQYSGNISSLSAPVPEAGTYAMLFVGLCGIGLVSLRRNRRD